MNRESYSRQGESLAVGLGWFSIALGVAELTAPHSVARFIGVAPTDRAVTTLRSYGARELSNGLAILAQPDSATWLWSRVAGDALDLATLGSAINAPDTHRGRAFFAAAAVLGVTVLDVICAQQLTAQQHEDGWYSDRRPALGSAAMSSRDSKVRVHETVTVNAPLDRVEEQWAHLNSMPESLRSLSRSTSDTDERAIVEMRQAPGGRGTEVRVEIEYTPRGGALGSMFARLTGGDPTGQIRQDLRRFKQIVETGEVVLSDGPSLWRPAQPPQNVDEVRSAAGVGVS
jgi:hypothetical protein